MNDPDLFDWSNDQPKKIPASDVTRLVLKSKEPCRCCGVTAALNPHRMDEQKVAVMRDMAVLLLTNNWVRVEAGRGLQGISDEQWKSTAYRAREHISRAAWLGLALTQGFRTSNWKLTRKGVEFLQGKIAVPRTILCRDGKVVYETIETLEIHDIKESFDKAYWDNYPWSELNVDDLEP